MTDNKLNRIISIDEDNNLLESFGNYLNNEVSHSIPKNIESSLWQASNTVDLDKSDYELLSKTTDKLILQFGLEQKSQILNLKQFIDDASNELLNTWQDMLDVLKWQVQTPAYVTRNAVTQDSLSLGTFTRGFDDFGNIEMNLNYFNQTNSIKLLVQATNLEGDAIDSLKVRINKDFETVVYESKTDEDGILNADNITLGEGIFQIEFLVNGNIVKTPVFQI